MLSKVVNLVKFTPETPVQIFHTGKFLFSYFVLIATINMAAVRCALSAKVRVVILPYMAGIREEAYFL